MNPEDFKLTIEQQFALEAQRQEANKMTKEALQELLLDATRLLMTKDNIIKRLLRDKAGSELSAALCESV